MKALGRDIKDFWHNHWPTDMYFEEADESLFDESGEPSLEDNVKYDLSRFGVLLQQANATAGDGLFSLHFNRWIKKRDTVTIVVSVPRGKSDAALAAIKALGWKAEMS